MTKEITRLLNHQLNRLNRSPGRLPRARQICSLIILPAALAGLSALSISCRPQPPAESVANPSPTVAQSPPYPMAVVGQPYPGRGVITLINLKEGWVEINHEPIAGLMPAMQMEWSVKDPALLRKVKVGDTVDFVVVENGKGELITELKKAEAPK